MRWSNSKDAVLTDLEKPDLAAPVTTECGEPAAFAPGPAHQAGPSPIETRDAQVSNEHGTGISGDAPLAKGMTNGKNATSGNARLEALLERQKQLDAQLAAEKLKLTKRKQKEEKKLGALLGRGVCAAAAQSPEFRLMLAQTLAGLGGIFTESEQRFLKLQGWGLS